MSIIRNRKSIVHTGFTLIEMLFSILVICLMIALLIPAVLHSREASRISTCKNNLRQIGIALQSYELRESCFPIGRYHHFDRRVNNIPPYCLNRMEDRSFLCNILPDLEMNSAYNSLNHMSWMLMPENTTIHAIQINTFVCPSDYLALRTLDAALSPRFPSFSPWRDDVARKVARASYAGIISTTFVYALPDMKLNCKIDPREVPLANGILTDIGPITQASIGDGSSNTMIVVERAFSVSDSGRFIGFGDNSQWAWWFLSSLFDTHVTTFYPPNWSIRQEINTSFQFLSASSMHTGGLNVLFADGSTKFLRDSINATTPRDDISKYQNKSSGVWQALGTRNGGEIIDNDSF